MKFCLINNLYKPYERGGAERIVELTAEGLAAAGHEVTVLSARPYFKDRQGGEGRVRNIYLPGIYHALGKVPLIPRLLWHIFDIFDPVNFLRVYLILKKGGFDAVITHNLKGLGFSIPMAVRILRLKHIHTLHDIQLIHPEGLMYYGSEQKVDSWPVRAYGTVSRFLFGPPHAVISPSEWLLDMHRRRGFFPGSRQVVLPNPTAVQGKPLADKGKNGPFRFLYVGIIEPHKGVQVLSEAFNILNAEISGQCELTIVGDGSLSASLSKEAVKRPNINILGRKNREVVARLMAVSDCLIVPSLCYENSPTVIYEALGAGLPVLGSNLGGIPELLDRDKTFLFDPVAEELAGKIAWAVANRQAMRDRFKAIRDNKNSLSVSGYIDKIIFLAD